MLKVSQFTGFGGGGTPPTIISASSVSLYENNYLAFSIVTNSMSQIIIGGIDAAKVELAANPFALTHTLRWAGNITKDYEAPNDANTDNVYSITLQAVDTSGNLSDLQYLNITVLDIMIEDPYWLTSTVFLTGFEGANGSRVVTDESFVGHHGNATVATGVITTADKKYGASSWSTNNQSLRWPIHNDFRLGTGPFTLECFFRLNSFASNNHTLMGVFSSSAGNLSWIMFVNTNGTAGQLTMNYSTTGSDNIGILATGFTDITSLGTWYHACIDFDGTTYRSYVNGVMKASSTSLHGHFASTADFAIGSNSDAGGLYLNGNIDEARITKVSRYAGTFTVPTDAYPRG
jgi:hypothetical protein